MRIRYSRFILNLFFVTVFLTLCSLVFALSVYADDGSGSTKTNPDENAYISGGNINEKGNNDAQVDESVLTNPDVLKSGESVSPENNEQINNQTLSSPSGVPEKIEKAADGKLYYIDSTGKRKTSAGWIYFDGKKYFASPGGSLYTNRMITFGSYGYYMGSDGSVLLGHFRGADRVYRYADAIGNLEDESYGKLAAVGWREDNYFAHGGYGALYHNQFISFGKVRYYMNTDGSVVKTEFNYGNKRYSPDPVTGEIKSGKAGWIIDKSKNTKKFAKGDGTLYINQMITFGSYGYYMGSDGSVLLGHFRGADRVYRYADAIGNLEDESYGKLAAVGWREDNYFAHGGYGALYHNQFISFGKVRYYMNTDGSVVKTEFNYGNKRYSPDPVTGEIKSGKAGWIIDKSKNTKKFAKGDGTLYINQMITFGSYGYYMGSDGSVLLGHFRGADGVYRYADAAGNLEDESYGKLAAVGWREDNYFAYGGYGELYHNQFITFGEKIYYMNTDGSIVKTPFRYRWANITPNPTTGLISRADYNRAVNTGPYPYQRYALVNLSQQYVQLWVNGRMIYSTLVVTGKPSTPTPRGTFSILYKTTNTYLTGPGYHLHVNYWMPFTHQGHGLHDAYWLKSNQFGGNTYLSGWGSHGCVNMPNSAAQTFYRYLSAGDRVIII